MDWTRLPLARGTVGRAANRRLDPDLLERAWHSTGTRVLLIADGRIATRSPGPAERGEQELDLYPPAALAHLTGDHPWAEGAGGFPLLLFLGQDGADTDPTTYLALVLEDRPAASGTRVGIEGVPDLSDASGMTLTWSTLRDVGHALDDHDAGLAATAVGLAAWHLRHPRCPRCGAVTVAAQGGWLRRCSIEGTDEYPRTDPAVIMAVIDPTDRLLLGHAAHWPERRYSTLAGYVEPGESIEDAVRREVAEESSVVVGPVEYRGSQPWPFPASLMLAFVARATTTHVEVDGVEITDARWFTRTELASEVRDRRVLLPMRTSVARALIEDWYGEDLDRLGS